MPTQASAALLLLVGWAHPAHSQTCGTAVNPVVCENALAGTTGWQISGAGDASIQGFATDISTNVSQTVFFKVKTTASNYRLDIYRMGYYGGAGARKITTVNPSVALPQSQPACITNAATHLYDCGNWAVSASWTVPAGAASGIYIAALVRPDTGGASHIVFIVRNDASHSDMLFQTADETWQAYNPYGGNSLYGDAGFNLPARAFKVSYNRPFATASLETATWLFNAEYPMVRWLEANGYDVTYFTGVDAARNGAVIKNHKVYLSVGHDEYWSAEHRAAVEAARDAGVNLAFFSGNEVFWKTRWENSVDGSNTPNRTLVCYKETLDNRVTDPLDPPTWTGTWRDPRFSPPADGGKPENALTGTIFTVNGPGSDNTNLSMLVPAADGHMRFWRNTSIANLASGQTATLPAGTLGYEWDSELDNGARPAGLFHLSTSTYNMTADLLLDYGSLYGPGTATHNMTMYRAASGALVFGAGTVQWAWGLDSNHDNGNLPPDVRMQQATVNVLADMGVQPATRQAGLVAATKTTDVTPPTSAITFPSSGSTQPFGTQVTITGTATDVGGGVVGGVEVSVDGGVTWHPANGRENWTYVWSTSLPNTGHLMSRAVDDSVNLETPNAGVNVTVPRPVSPITLDVTATGDGPSASTSVQTAAFSTTAVNELLLAFVSGDYLSGVNTTVTGVTGGGLTWALVQRTNGQSGTAEIWRAFAPVLLSNVRVTATLSQSVIASITVMSMSGVDASGTNGSGAIGAVGSKNATSGAPTAQLVTTRNSSWVFGVGTDYDNPIARVPQAGQSIVHQYLTPAGDTYWVQMQSGPTPVSGTTVTISDTTPTGDRYNLSICEVLPTQVQTWILSGSVSPTPGGSGVLMALNGPSTGTVTTDVSGNYSFVGLAAGTYVVTPSKTGFTFSPANQTVTIIGANAGNVTFTAIPMPTFNISGAVAPAAIGSGTLLSMNASGETSGAIPPVTADASGNYTFTGLPNNTYTITPSKAATSYTPATQTVAINGASIGGINFAGASVPVWSISGNIAPAAGGSGATVTLSGTSTATVTADSSGNFTFANQIDGSYTVTPSKTGFAFTPANQPANVSGANVTGINFTAQTTVAPPLVSNVNAAGGGGTAIITWTTDTPSNSRVDYGLAANSLSLNVSDPAPVTSHSITLTSLTVGTTYYFRVTSTDGFGNATISPPLINAAASFTEAALNSIWNSSAVPGTPSDSDPSSVELGLKFRSDVAGSVTGVRFYKGSLNTSTHTGNLWTSAGVLLASVTFSGETASGWQQANFSAPVSINANTTYVISYFTPGGHYSADAGFLAAAVDSPPLHALANGVDGPNGVYVYTGVSAFPTQTFNATNYWVDVVFVLAGGPTLPVISNVAATATTSTATITWTTNVATDARVDYGTSSGSLTFNQSSPTIGTTHSINLSGLTPGTTYFYRVTSVDGSGNTAVSPATPNLPLSFVTLTNTPPVISGVTAIPGAAGAATITWNTNTASTTRVDYGTSAGSLTLNVSDPALVTTHSIGLTGLNTGTTYFFNVTSTDGAGNTATAPAIPASFVEAGLTSRSIWTSATTPATVDGGDPGSVELGMKFRSDVPGFITGLRFYKSAGNTGTHVGNLWSSTGALLANVTFVGETVSGWQQASFATPVAITANTTYVISYFAPNGHYSDNAPFFNAGSIDSPPLHALADGADGPNGVYLYGAASGFPTQTFSSSNYWVDPVFTSATVTAFPASVVIETGTLSAGAVARLNVDDNSYFQVNSTTSGTRTLAWYGSFPATPRSMTGLLVTYKGKDSRSCTETVSIWNWASSVWVQLDSRAATTTEVLRSLTPSGALSNFVSGSGTTGELRVEVKCSTTANVTGSADLMSIEYNN